MKKGEGAIQFTARKWAETHTPDMVRTLSPISIFDPVLTELVYRWFCPPEGVILDPFAGGSVRGIVASRLGFRYVGVDLSEKQIDANREQSRMILDGETPWPIWLPGDSRDIQEIARGVEADLVFTCPPYADLEVYSDHPADISNMVYPEFLDAYDKIIAAACTLLKPDRFAAIVVGEVRDKQTHAYYGLVPDTIAAFEAAGLSYHNEAIIVTPTGTLAIRTARQFDHSRKMGKTHQNLLVFCKGDPLAATDAAGAGEFGSVMPAGTADVDDDPEHVDPFDYGDPLPDKE
jgi:hypothetical protein